MSDGLLFDIESGDWAPVPEAPLQGRYSAASIWTGSEFVVFGGHSFEDSFVDGAAFDPVARAWREIADAPFSPAAHPSATWDGSKMLVWMAGNDSEFARLPHQGVGQTAAYDPTADAWLSLNAPEVSVVDASLVTSDRGLVLVGGPTTRDLGTVGPVESVKASIQDPTTGAWSDPIEGPEVESVRPFVLPDGGVAGLTEDGSLYRLGDTDWKLLTRIPDACWHDIGAASGGDAVFLKSCATFVVKGADPALILDADAYGATTNPFGSGFLVADTGTLATLTDAELDTGASGTVIVGVFESSE